VGKKLAAQAHRQVKAAEGNPIRWVVAEAEFARGLRTLFRDEGITGIEVVVEAMK
jgi:hypothetical protein